MSKYDVGNYLDQGAEYGAMVPNPVVAVPSSVYTLGRDVQHIITGTPNYKGEDVTLPTLGADALNVGASAVGAKAGQQAIAEGARIAKGVPYQGAFTEVGKEMTARLGKVKSMGDQAWHKSMEMLHMSNLPDAPHIVRDWLNNLADVVGYDDAVIQIHKLQQGDPEMTREAGIALQQVLSPAEFRDGVSFAKDYANSQIPQGAEQAYMMAQDALKEAPKEMVKKGAIYSASLATKKGLDESKPSMSRYTVDQ